MFSSIKTVSQNANTHTKKGLKYSSNDYINAVYYKIGMIQKLRNTRRKNLCDSENN